MCATWNTDNPKVANQVTADIADIEENFQELHDVVEAVTSGTLGTTEPANFKVDVVTGYKTFYVAATSPMYSTTTNGAASGDVEFVTNDIQFSSKLFDSTTEEFAVFSMVMPEDWDRGTIKAKFFWYPLISCSAGDTVEWKLAAGALSNDDAIDAALGTGQVISDTVLAGVNADLHISGATPAITVGGTPALGDLIYFKISRNVSGTDDMTEDAALLGVWIQYQATNKPAAW